MTKRIPTLFAMLGTAMLPLAAQTIFFEDFDGVGGPTAGGAGTYSFPSGWILANVDNRTPAAQVAYVNEAWERREDFSFNVLDSAAFSTSWYTSVGSADDWMWTPQMTLTAQNVLSWNGVGYDPLYPETYEVRLMVAPNTPSGGTGTLGNMVSASTLLTTITEGSNWGAHSVSLALYAGQTVRIGFRNISNDRFLLILDDILVEAQLTAELQMLAADTITPYTMIPLEQASPLHFEGTMRNNGLNALSDVSAEVQVLRNGTAVHNASSTPQSTLAPGATTGWTIPGYTPDAVGDYTVRLIARHSATDQAPLNDTLTRFFTISDTTYARDDGELSGSLGIGAGNGGYMGQSFELANADTLTSVGVVYFRGYTGRQAAVVIWDMVDGMPNNIIAGTDTILYPDNELLDIQLPIHGGAAVLPAGLYAVTAVEFDSTLALGQTTNLFTPGTTWVDWPTSPIPGWANNEDFGPSFSKSYMIRPNFGHACAGFGVEAGSTSATCATCADGAVSATTGNDSDVSFTWDPPVGNGATVPDVATGTYTVTAMNGMGCIATATITVAFDTCAFLTAAMITGNASCANCSDGTASLEVSGDNGGLQYDWSNGSTAPEVEGLLPGAYTVTVTDQYGCSIEVSGAVDFSTGMGDSRPLAGAAVHPNPSSGRFRIELGAPTGPLEITLHDARGRKVWSTRWNTSMQNTLLVEQELAAGNYTLRLVGNEGTRTLPVIITAR
ncbi:MAG TPA: choice-of-anchor J domain-containing protein [Flavobacteriales bacterium]